MCGKDVSDRPTTASLSAAGANGSMPEVERGWGEAIDEGWRPLMERGRGRGKRP